MTLLFSGNDFKYEIEAVVKLYYPVVSFDIRYCIEKVEGDYICARRKRGKVHTYLFSIVSINGVKIKKVSKVANGIENYEQQCEQALCRMVFLSLRELTDKHISWGMLTGVRPVKLVNKAIIDFSGDKEKVFDHFKTNFYTDESKINLAYQTSQVQKRLLSDLGEKSFSLYVSIPFCPTRCSYCSFVSQEVDKMSSLIPEYVDKLCDEIAVTARVARECGLTLDTVYFGGGTPTSLSPEHLEKILTAVSDNFNLKTIREYTVEAGRADTITREKLEVIKAFGVDRISINPQTLNNEVLKKIRRNHTSEDFYNSYSLAKKIGFKVINTDVIAGLPSGDFTSFKNTIDRLVELKPENITVHTLSIKRTANINSAGEGLTAIENSAKKMVEYSIDKLMNERYMPYYLYRQKNMVDNLENIGYSQEGFESLYNIFIMEEVQTILAIGAGASTKLVNNGRIERVFNYKLPLEYIKNFDIMVSKKQAITDFFNR